METIESIYEKAKKAHAMASEGILRISEAQSITDELWNDLHSIYEKDSIEWRKVNAAHKKRNPWWSTPGVSDYAKQDDAKNIHQVISIIEQITGKNQTSNIRAIGHTMARGGKLRWLFSAIKQLFSHPASLSPLELLSAVGSIASIIGLVIVFYTMAIAENIEGTTSTNKTQEYSKNGSAHK